MRPNALCQCLLFSCITSCFHLLFLLCHYSAHTTTVNTSSTCQSLLMNDNPIAQFLWSPRLITKLTLEYFWFALISFTGMKRSSQWLSCHHWKHKVLKFYLWLWKADLNSKYCKISPNFVSHLAWCHQVHNCDNESLICSVKNYDNLSWPRPVKIGSAW